MFENRTRAVDRWRGESDKEGRVIRKVKVIRKGSWGGAEYSFPVTQTAVSRIGCLGID